MLGAYRVLLQELSRVFVDGALYSVLLFAPARTFNWPRAWVVIAASLACRVPTSIYLWLHSPALLAERAKGPLQQTQPLSDRILLPVFMASFAAHMAFTSFDLFHFHVYPELPLRLSAAGLATVVLGWFGVAVALATNQFASMVVRHQPDRQHRIVDHGVYSVVRHPMYAGIVLVLCGLPVWLGSVAGLAFAAVPIGILAARIIYEERHLAQQLEGYKAYAQKVRWRIVPFVW